MATVYRFIVESKGGGTGSGDSRSGSGRPRTAKTPKIKRQGVEHNRKLRAINPVLNKATGGAYEKSMRLGRAGVGLIRGSSVAVAIIISFVLQQLMKWQNKEIQMANAKNTQDYKRLENGLDAIHSAYEVSENFLTGRISYKENK